MSPLCLRRFEWKNTMIREHIMFDAQHTIFSWNDLCCTSHFSNLILQAAYLWKLLKQHFPELYTEKSNSMVQSPSWKANSASGSPEISHIFWNPRDPFCIHKHLPLVPTLSQMNPVHKLPPYFRSILIVSYHLHLGFLSASYLHVSTSENLSPVGATCPNHLIPLGMVTLIWWGVKYAWSISTIMCTAQWVYHMTLPGCLKTLTWLRVCVTTLIPWLLPVGKHLEFMYI
jgi:hypothetical protein